MTRILTVIPATVTVGAVLLLGWGCATVPPNQSPHDPFETVEPGLAPPPSAPTLPPPQRSGRPNYTVPFVPPQQTVPPYPYRTSPPTRTPQPFYAPAPRVPQQAPAVAPNRSPQPSPTPTPRSAPPKTFADPEPNSQPIPSRPPGANPAQPFRPDPYRTEKRLNPFRPSPQLAPPQPPKKQPAPVTPPPSDGPTLFPPEDVPTASRTSLPKFTHDQTVELTVVAPDRRPVGSGAPFQLTVKNASEQVLRNLQIVCEFDDALTFPGSDRKSVTHKVPKIESGDARESLLTLVSEVPGRYQCRFTVHVGSKSVATKTVGVEFVSRQLDWQLHGPTERTVGSRAEFNIPLINVTDRNLKGLTVRVDLDSALSIREMTQGGKLDDRSVTWTIDNLASNEGMLLQLEVECREPSMQACLTATVSGEDVPADDTEAFLSVKPVTGLLDVRVQDVTDPVAAGEDAEIVVTVVNAGLQSAKDVAVTCHWPDGFEFASAALVRGGKPSSVKAAVRDGTATLPTVSRLDADQKLEYRLKVSASRAGAHQLRISVSDGSGAPAVEVMEPIMVHR